MIRPPPYMRRPPPDPGGPPRARPRPGRAPDRGAACAAPRVRPPTWPPPDPVRRVRRLSRDGPLTRQRSRKDRPHRPPAADASAGRSGGVGPPPLARAAGGRRRGSCQARANAPTIADRFGQARRCRERRLNPPRTAPGSMRLGEGRAGRSEGDRRVHRPAIKPCDSPASDAADCGLTLGASLSGESGPAGNDEPRIGLMAGARFAGAPRSYRQRTTRQALSVYPRVSAGGRAPSRVHSLTKYLTRNFGCARRTAITTKPRANCACDDSPAISALGAEARQ
jgi:hypothetical protein